MKTETQNFTEWENQVTEHLQNNLKTTRGDAQGFLEANEFYASQAWGMGLNAEEAAVYIFSKAFFEEVESLN